MQIQIEVIYYSDQPVHIQYIVISAVIEHAGPAH